MKRLICAALVVCTVGSFAGCVAVSAKNCRWPSEVEAVAVGDKIYVVHTRTGRVAQVDTTKLCCIRDLDDDDHCD